MSRVVRSEAQKGTAGVGAGARSAKTKAALVSGRAPQTFQPAKKCRATTKKLSGGASSVSRMAVNAQALRGPFPSPLRMPSAMEVYPAVFTGAVGKNREGGFPAGDSRSLSEDYNAVAKMFLRQLRDSCAAYAGKAPDAINGIGVGHSGCGGRGGGLGGLCLTPGLGFYRHLHDLHRWLFSCDMCKNGRPMIVCRAWQALFSKKHRSWRTFLTLLDSEMILADENAASGLLTVLYNVLRMTNRTRRKRIVKLCLKFQMLRTCVSILEVYEDTFAAAVEVYDYNQSRGICGGVSSRAVGALTLGSTTLGPNNVALSPFAFIRVVEGVALLLGLCGSENTRVLRLLRHSKALPSLLRAADSLVTLVARQLARVRIDCADDVGDDDEGGAEAACCRGGDSQTGECPTFGPILALIDVLLHLMITFYQLASYSANAEFMGARGVVLSLEIGWLVLSFFTKTRQRLRTPLKCVQDRLETLVLRSIELFCRLCSGKKVNRKALELAREKGAVALFVKFSTYPAGCAEVPIFSLKALNTLTTKESGCREQLYSDLKELCDLVRGVVVAAESTDRSPAHWHELYLSLYALFGIVTLPGEVPAVRVVPTPIAPSGFMPNSSQGCFLHGAAEGTTPPFLDLPIDLLPDAFSLELRENVYFGSSTDLFAFSPPDTLPWGFLDDGLPTSREIAASLYPTAEANALEVGGCPLPHVSQALQPPSSRTRVQVLKRLIERLCTTSQCMDRIIYERCSLTPRPSPPQEMAGMPETTRLWNEDESSGSNATLFSDFLKFRADFECGNLQRVIAVDAQEYDLVLSPDTNTNCHVQWFCFSVEQYTPGMTYHFNILNMEKSDSTFNEGQRPLMLFVEDSPSNEAHDIPQWTRCGHDIFYFRNLYQRPARCTTTTTVAKTSLTETSSVSAVTTGNGKSSGGREKTVGGGKQALKKGQKTKVLHSKRSKARKEEVVSFCYTLSFSVTFPEKKGRVFFANCFPYTYSNLLADVRQWRRQANISLGASVVMAVQQLCCTPGGLPVPILTVTAASGGGGVSDCGDSDNGGVGSDGNGEKNMGDETNPAASRCIEERPVCVVTARVHPGESNSSWMMRGLVAFLLRDDKKAHALRSRFVWKIIPMLNPDGVVVGNHRCSLGGADMNRDYTDPKPWINPVIYSLKQLIQHMIVREQRHVGLFVDFHGHSRAKNFLIYGCTRRLETQESKLAVKTTAVPLPSSVAPGSLNSPSRRHRSVSGTTASANGLSTSAEKIIPLLLSGLSSAFAMSQCSFVVHKSKRNAGRVVMYRQFGIRMSYTLEASMMGGKDDGASCCGAAPLQREREERDDNTEDAGEERESAEKSGEDPIGPQSQEVSYDTRHYGKMGALLAHSLGLLASDGGRVDVNDKAVIERAWSQLLVTAGSVDVPTHQSSLLLGGSYAFATRKERRPDGNKTKKKMRNTATLSAEQRKEILRSLLVRPKISGVHPIVGCPAVLLTDSDDEDELGSLEEDHEDEEKGVDGPPRGSYDESIGSEEDDDNNNDEEEEDENEDEEDEEDEETEEEEENGGDDFSSFSQDGVCF